MPIYEYQCQACGHQLEAFQGISEEPLTRCPVCDRPALNKLISSTSFQLKGTGWYATDFRGKDKPASTATVKNETKPTTTETKVNDKSTE